MSTAFRAEIRVVEVADLALSYEIRGPEAGEVVICLHGFPYDPRCYDVVAASLAAQGYRAIVPYLRGYGPTRFRSPSARRSGQQAALGKDLLDLMDALALRDAVLVGYDWGGRAACIVAALWPERVRALITGNGYNIQEIESGNDPASAETEHRLWYQHYFNTPRGAAGLEANRRQLCRLLWRQWSPSWPFQEDTFARSAASFDNPAFVDVVIHSYRHRFGNVAGDPALESIERALAQRPKIVVPTIALFGADDGVHPPDQRCGDDRHFMARYQARVLPGVGHNPPQEDPDAVLAALRTVFEAGALRCSSTRRSSHSP